MARTCKKHRRAAKRIDAVLRKRLYSEKNGKSVYKLLFGKGLRDVYQTTRHFMGFRRERLLLDRCNSG